jgi:hypothetical protein
MQFSWDFLEATGGLPLGWDATHSQRVYLPRNSDAPLKMGLDDG